VYSEERQPALEKTLKKLAHLPPLVTSNEVRTI
jgi:hypothetical protein